MYTSQIGGSFGTVTDNGPAKLVVHTIGPHPILRHFLERMTFSRIVNSCLGTANDSRLSHAETLSVLIQNIILSPAPLYRIAQWAEPIDPEALGLTAQQKAALNDDRMARSLEALASSRARSLFFRLALHVIKAFQLDTSRIHQDTTTVTFHGRYDGSVLAPRITHGLNKDHRPDLKQLVFGLNVTGDGAVPIAHEVYSGNRTDDTIHTSNLATLRSYLNRHDFIYVADSKLCTQKNLKDITDHGGKFVTVLPRTRREDIGFRADLRHGALPVRWRKLLERPNSRCQRVIDTYWTTADGPQQSEEGYRIIWCRSSQKIEFDAQARVSALERAEEELAALANSLPRDRRASASAIKKKAQAILRQARCEGLITIQVSVQTVVSTKRLRPGRPAKDDPVQQVSTKVLQLAFARDDTAIREQARTDGVFPLLTNLDKTHAKKDVLLIYKYQPYVEKRHALFKSELGIAPVYLKKPRRAAGLVHATFLAMTVEALIERTVRHNMAKHHIASLAILPEGRRTKTPTTARILEAFSGVTWFEFQRQDEHIAFPVKLDARQRELLKLLGIDKAIYQ